MWHRYETKESLIRAITDHMGNCFLGKIVDVKVDGDEWDRHFITVEWMGIQTTKRISEFMAGRNDASTDAIWMKMRLEKWYDNNEYGLHFIAPHMRDQWIDNRVNIRLEWLSDDFALLTNNMIMLATIKYLETLQKTSDTTQAWIVATEYYDGSFSALIEKLALRYGDLTPDQRSLLI